MVLNRSLLVGLLQILRRAGAFDAEQLIVLCVVALRTAGVSDCFSRLARSSGRPHSRVRAAHLLGRTAAAEHGCELLRDPLSERGSERRRGADRPLVTSSACVRLRLLHSAGPGACDVTLPGSRCAFACASPSRACFLSFRRESFEVAGIRRCVFRAFWLSVCGGKTQARENSLAAEPPGLPGSFLQARSGSAEMADGGSTGGSWGNILLVGRATTGVREGAGRVHPAQLVNVLLEGVRRGEACDSAQSCASRLRALPLPFRRMLASSRCRRTA